MSTVTVFGLILSAACTTAGLIGRHAFLALAGGAGLVWFGLRVGGILA